MIVLVWLIDAGKSVQKFSFLLKSVKIVLTENSCCATLTLVFDEENTGG